MKLRTGSPPVSLDEIRYVLLDMDGTLLDRYFDDYFWEHLLPEKYAEKKHISFGKAREELLAKYHRHLGTLNWTDIDFWSREVEIDIPALKEQVRHLIEVHPHVEEFLAMLRRRRKKVFLVTNAHYKVLEIKLQKTEIGKYFHAALTSFEIGFPKERLEFWERARKRLGFENETSLLVDDTVPVLRTAKEFGIRHILHKTVANSKIPRAEEEGFITLNDFGRFL